MTNAEIEAAILEDRFNANYTAQITRWRKAAYTEVWYAADWSFRCVAAEDSSLVVVANNRKPTMPTNFDRDLALWDDNGNLLERLDTFTFDSRYASDTSTGKPAAYKIVNGQIILGPTPDLAYSFPMPYLRKLSHYTSANVMTVGQMSLATDKPCWSEDHHELLVVRAQMLGLKYTDDPDSANAMQPEYTDLLQKMIVDLAEDLVTPYRDTL